ncbi:putative Cuticular protein analogous to peritrophins 3-C [Daphnia magna]|uniref:Putative Cuticular protein analogous to peritrophins 3-C n=1 Tax=Daphnia magna TaxID=35525 RepID=A0A164VQM0_9CRUS|nr:putative Cuticular protein analogous to peritrophins 3-C [Daphnia magna]
MHPLAESDFNMTHAITSAQNIRSDAFVCPKENGFFAHDISCDKYWKCVDGVATLEVCGNGLAFDDTDPKNNRENCDYVYNIECGDRLELEPPISTPHCPSLHGVFPDETKCDVFWSCWNGEASRYQCAPGLAYSRESRVCTWADQVANCKQEEVGNGFICPVTGDVATGAFSRHAHPEDCRQYYVCMNGNAREYGCPLGTVFKIGLDDQSGFCADPEEVEGCQDYYADSGLDIKQLSKLGF